MNRILIGLLLAALLAAGVAGWYLKAQIARVSVLQTENKSLKEGQERAAEALKKAQTALRSREKQIVSQARKLEEAQQGLSAALRANKQWSDTDVPTDVQKELGGALSRPADGVRDD